jgi:hypothetical protein
MIVTWTEPIPGREAKALEYGADVAAFWTKQAEAGKCTDPELFFSERGVGMWMVKGDRDVLLSIHDSDEAQLLIMRGQLLLSDFGVDFYTAGEASDAFMARYMNALGALT